jgi:membrane protein implicated in regulation of membrane protease activity
MSAWVIWMVAAGLLAIGEILTLSFFMGPVAVAAFLAGIAALLGANTALQLVVFILASIASLAVLRPVARRHLQTPAKIRTGTEALIGAPAVTLERVDRDGGTVKLSGEVWSARTYDEDEVLEAGARVQVIKIEGATALVANGLGG